MTPRLPPVLSAIDLPEAELLAALHDGEVFRVDGCFTPIDEIEQPHHRARALHAGLSERLIAEQLSAAWIWGALDAPPAHHQLCVAMGARVGHARPPWMTVREVVVEPHEIASLDGFLVTTRVRTAVDLARFSAHFGEKQARVIQALDVSIADCIDDLERRHKLPNKRQAIERLSSRPLR